jgi:hypothetical protein
MPLTVKGEKIENAMEKTYGTKKGEKVFYASRNSGRISGVDAESSKPKPSGFAKLAMKGRKA